MKCVIIFDSLIKIPNHLWYCVSVLHMWHTDVKKLSPLTPWAIMSQRMALTKNYKHTASDDSFWCGCVHVCRLYQDFHCQQICVSIKLIYSSKDNWGSWIFIIPTIKVKIDTKYQFFNIKSYVQYSHNIQLKFERTHRAYRQRGHLPGCMVNFIVHWWGKVSDKREEEVKWQLGINGRRGSVTGMSRSRHWYKGHWAPDWQDTAASR